MISQLSMRKVASFKETPAILDTDKRVNLIYGLNGTGKSTISRYLRDKNHTDFSHCSVNCDGDEVIHVYNQDYIEDTFFEDLPGIFTIAKENKEAQSAISNAEKEIATLEAEVSAKNNDLSLISNELASRSETAKDKCWEIKTSYSGGDRVLDYCLSGLGRKELLFAHLNSIPKPAEKPMKTIAEIEEEIKKITAGAASRLNSLNPFSFGGETIETDEIFSKVIVGSTDSTVAALIEKLQNSSWVKQGIDFLPEEIGETNETCPFCQQTTISKDFIASIKDYFDESYENDRRAIEENLEGYKVMVEAFPKASGFTPHEMLSARKSEFEAKHSELTSTFARNIQSIQIKLNDPSQKLILINTSTLISDLNELIDDANAAVKTHNAKIENPDAIKAAAKKEFWEIMRWEYDQTLENLANERTTAEAKASALEGEIKNLADKVKEQKRIIATKQRETINVDESIHEINAALVDLGIDDFRIKKVKGHSKEGDFYKLVRDENDSNVFKSLSEGEKMIISFLYFLEACRKRGSATDTVRKKIVVIDDPISSLSHIHVFNVGRLIKNEFMPTKDGNGNWVFKYDQVYVMTHSLYFFYEVTEPKHDARKETQKLFRLSKSAGKSAFNNMSYEEIQNDYQAYWYIIKDSSQPPALVANCMRNVIEYFFNFVEKKDLNNFFREPAMQNIRFQAFYRYVNRESHSLGQNIFDFKEFDYAEFKDAFECLFDVAGYKGHYTKMMQ